jgi:hypothetical protein
MTDKPENPLAFPSTGEGFGNPKYSALGMTLRDYFAGQALVSAANNPTNAKCAITENRRMTGYVAELCYLYADEMLKARENANNS